MDINNALSPLDGRYNSKICDVNKVFNNKNFTKQNEYRMSLFNAFY